MLKLGDSVTTDHISPAGAIPIESVAGKYLQHLGVNWRDFNSYGSRRGNHEVMMRGTFSNIRIRNLKLKNFEGPFTKVSKNGEIVDIFTACENFGFDNLIVIAGKYYGTGSSRD